MQLRLFALLSLIALVSCGSPAPKPIPVDAREAPRDFSGHWEVDFSASDTVNGQVSATLRQWQRSMERSARNNSRGNSGVQVGIGGVSPRDIIALADMAEIITEPQLLEVLQTADEVRVRRENNFALVCDFTKTPPVVNRTPYGEEACTWSGRELLFRIDLPEGLTVQHQILLSEDRNALALTTLLSSAKVREPISIRKVFNRYDPETGIFRCTETLSRGRVCTTEQPKSP